MNKAKKIINKNCHCDTNDGAIQFQKITINRSDLKLYIREYDDAQRAKNSWHFPLTVLVSLLIAITTTKFQPNVTLPITGHIISIPDGMSLVLWAATFAVSIWTINNLIKSATTKDPHESLLSKINLSILNKPDRTSVFIIKRESQGEIELLVEKKGSWACYFLPYVKQAALTEYTSNQKYGTTKSLGDKLGVNAENIKIDLLQEFNFKSEKFDPPQKVVKEYHFEVFHVTISDNKLQNNDFQIGDRSYYWKTLNELEKDDNTRRNNKDIISHLRDNYNDLILKVSNHNA